MKKVLLTGSNGLLGQKLIERIIRQKDFELVATSRGENRYPIKTGYEYAPLEVTAREEVFQTLEKYRPDAVIHTAAMTNVDTCEKEREACKILNVDAVKYLAEACLKLDIQLIHLSTDFIFDGLNGPYDEEAVPNPLSYYGQTKLAAEQILENSACRYAILRTIIVYGIVNDMSRSNIVLWAKGALEKGQPINVVDDQWRMPTLAEDLAEICLLAVQKNAQGIFNASGKDMMSIIELVQKVAAFWQLDSSLIKPISAATLNQTAPRPVRTGFILSKSEQELGYAPHTFEEGLALLDQQLKSRMLD
ncbi:MAG: SDR family oxidoreductase [Sphingobacteriaceae bacterium]